MHRTTHACTAPHVLAQATTGTAEAEEQAHKKHGLAPSHEDHGTFCVEPTPDGCSVQLLTRGAYWHATVRAYVFARHGAACSRLPLPPTPPLPLTTPNHPAPAPAPDQMTDCYGAMIGGFVGLRPEYAVVLFSLFMALLHVHLEVVWRNSLVHAPHPPHPPHPLHCAAAPAALSEAAPCTHPTTLAYTLPHPRPLDRPSGAPGVP